MHWLYFMFVKSRRPHYPIKIQENVMTPTYVIDFVLSNYENRLNVNKVAVKRWVIINRRSMLIFNIHFVAIEILFAPFCSFFSNATEIIFYLMSFLFWLHFVLVNKNFALTHQATHVIYILRLRLKLFIQICVLLM